MFLGAAPTIPGMPGASAQGGPLSKNPAKTIRDLSSKTPIEKAMPWIVGISGILTIASLALALSDRYSSSNAPRRKRKPKGHTV